LGDVIIFHLTQGVNLSNPKQNAAAFRIDGQVRIAPSEPTPQGLEIAFLQFVRFNFLGMYYAGRTQREGSVAIDAKKNLKFAAMSDPNPTMPPWISEKPFAKSDSQALAKNSMGDHPYLRTTRRAFNFKTQTPNYLFHVIDDRDFWTVFSVRNQKGAFEHLMHIHWHVRHDVKFEWNSGNIGMKVDSSTIAFDDPLVGWPADHDLAGFERDPGKTPFAKDDLDPALVKSVGQGDPARSDNDARFLNVPADFFR